MMPELIIDPAIRRWIPPLDAGEYALLEASLLADGCRDALVAWNQTLIDGHHRYAICQAHQLPFRVTTLAFADADHAEIWVRRNQAGRRNLTDDQRAANAAMQAEAEARIAKRERAKAAVDQREVKAGRKSISEITVISKIDPPARSRQTAATTHSVSERRVARVQRIRQSSPTLAQDILSGTVTIKDAERTLRDQERMARTAAAVEDAKRQRAAIDDRIRHESFTTTAATLADGSVDLVFTDPPYGDRTLSLYADLGRVATRVLKEGGSLITYTAHHRLPAIIRMLEDAGLTFFWPLAIVHTGQKTRMTEFGVVVHWKLLLWFVNGPFRDRSELRFVNDLVESTREKTVHPWQQSLVEARYYIEALTHPGDLVFDPFCGGGTTAVAAEELTRRWLTCDVDEQAVWIARQRVRDVCEHLGEVTASADDDDLPF